MNIKSRYTNTSNGYVKRSIKNGQKQFYCCKTCGSKSFKNKSVAPTG